MKKIIIIGAGAMGSAFSVPCLENKNEVTLVSKHIENKGFFEKFFQLFS